MRFKFLSIYAFSIIGAVGFLFIHPVLSQPVSKEFDQIKPVKLQGHTTDNVTNNTWQSTRAMRDVLELEKLRAEIDKLKHDRNSGRYTLLLQSGTLFSALLAAAISAWSASRAQRLQIASLTQQSANSKQERISSLLHELGSENSRSRVAAARAIGEYPESTVFLVDVLQSEKDTQVIETVIASLKAIGGSTIKILRDATISIHKQEILLIAKLRDFNEPIENIATLIGLSIQDAKRIFASNEAVQLQSGTSKKQSVVTPVCPLVDSSETRSSLMKMLMSLQQTHAVVRRAIEEVAAHSVPDFAGDLRNGHLRFINLSGLSLRHWLFDGADLTMCNLSNSILDGSSFIETRMPNAGLQGSSFKNCVFLSAELSGSNFKMAKLHDAIFDSSSCKAAKFSGAKLTRTSFRDAKLHAAKFISVFAKYTVFDNAELFRCIFSSSIISNGSFRSSNLSGAELNGVKAIGADFTGAIFSGTEVKGSSLQDAIFADTDFNCFKEVGGTDFSNASFKGARFHHSYDFEAYVASICKGE